MRIFRITLGLFILFVVDISFTDRMEQRQGYDDIKRSSCPPDTPCSCDDPFAYCVPVVPHTELRIYKNYRDPRTGQHVHDPVGGYQHNEPLTRIESKKAVQRPEEFRW